MNETVPTAEISNREWLARESPVGVRFGSNYFDFKFSCCQFFNNHLEPNPCHSCPSLLMTEPYGSLTFMLSQSSLIYTFTVFSFAIYPNKCIMVNFWDRNKTVDFEQQFSVFKIFKKLVQSKSQRLHIKPNKFLRGPNGFSEWHICLE